MDNSLSVLGYRYLKLFISRETGGRAGGAMVLNEIEFYEGVLAQVRFPLESSKMLTPRTPPPQMVTCSSFESQDTHCYKAFDGDASSSSAWVTQGVGSRRNQLATPQWVIFDFGAGHGVRPIAMRIVCDAAHATGNTGDGGESELKCYLAIFSTQL